MKTGIFDWKNPGLFSQDSKLRHWILLFNIILINLVLVVQTLAVAVPISIIEGYLAVDPTKTEWINDAFLLALGISVPLSIYFSRQYGYKILLFVGLATFVLGAILAAFSTNYVLIVISRAIQGLGGGVIFPLSLTVVKRIFKGVLQKVAISLYMAIAFGVGLALGGFLGGYLGQLYSWRTIFILGAAIGVICLFVTWIIMHESAKYPVTSFDMLSFTLFCVFLTLTLVYLTQVKAPWNTLGFRSDFSNICAFLALACFAFFLIRYKRINTPLFALSMFKRKDFTISCIAMAFVGIMIFGSTVANINLMIGAYEYEKITAGKLISVVGLCFAIGGLIPVLIGRWVSIHTIAIMGLFFVMLSCFMNHSLTLQSEPKDFLIILGIRALGTSLALGPLTAIALLSIPDDLAGQAAAIVTIFRQVGGAYGSAIIGIVTTMRFPYHLTKFAEMVNPSSAAMQDYIIKFTNRGIDYGNPDIIAEKQTYAYLVDNLMRQTQIAAFDDAFYIFGWIFVILIFLLAYLQLFPQKREVLTEN